MAVVEKQAIACVGSSLVGYTKSGKSRHVAGVDNSRSWYGAPVSTIQQHHWKCTIEYCDSHAYQKSDFELMAIPFGLLQGKGR